jgi:hypothetical protein
VSELGVLRSAPPERVPTLTEVLPPGLARSQAGLSGSDAVMSEAASSSRETLAAPPRLPPDAPRAQPAPAQSLSEAEFAMAQRLLASLEPVLHHALSQMVEEVVAATRAELASTLREQVSLAVAQEFSGHRSDSVLR